MVSARATILAIALLPLAFVRVGKREAEERLQWWLQQPNSRGGVYAQANLDGIEYRALLRAAVAYDSAALAALFRYTADGQLMGEGADTNCEIMHRLLEHWGDGRFAAVLTREPPRVRKAVIAAIEDDFPDWSRRAFPRTYRLATHQRF